MLDMVIEYDHSSIDVDSESNFFDEYDLNEIYEVLNNLHYMVNKKAGLIK